MDKISTKTIGVHGEDLAVEYLKSKGYEILTRNYVPHWLSRGKKEIDIVAKKSGVLVFVEVKTGKIDDGFSPQDHVDFRKQRFLIKTAESYLAEKKIPEDTPWQIDVVAITFGEEKPKIEHFENAIAGS